MWKQSNNNLSMSEGGFTCGWTSSGTLHIDEITSVSMHPTGDYLVTTSLDGTWGFLDVNQDGRCLKQIDLNDTNNGTGTGGGTTTNDEKHSLIAGCFHPDGLIFATSTLTTSTAIKNGNNNDITTNTAAHVLSDFYNSDAKSLITSALSDQFNYTNSLKIWDIREQKTVATFLEHSDIIGDVSFSENGFYIATGCNDGVARIWDLRKLKCLKNIQGKAVSIVYHSVIYLVYDSRSFNYVKLINIFTLYIYISYAYVCLCLLLLVGTPVTSVSFDHSGLYLAAGGGFSGAEDNNNYTMTANAKINAYGVRLFYSKDWSLVTVGIFYLYYNVLLLLLFKNLEYASNMKLVIVILLFSCSNYIYTL